MVIEAGTTRTPLATSERLVVPAPTEIALERSGRYRFGLDRWEYLPFAVPAGVTRITVEAEHSALTLVPGVAGNCLDLGLFGPPGWQPGQPDTAAAGFRGWSGGARRVVSVGVDEATPGYLAGPITPGTWAVALGPVVLSPLGMRWAVRVTLEYGDADLPTEPATTYAPEAVPGRGPGWYRGDLHLHTVHSDGQRTPEELAKAAREAGLDFFASTDHNTNAAHRSWGQVPLDDLLVLPGEEVTTRHGHWLAVGLPDGAWVDWRYGRGGLPRYAAQVRAAGGLVVAAHPAAPLPSVAWEHGYAHVDAVEVWNGRWGVDDEVSLRIWDRLLRRGRRVAAVGGSDAHAYAHAVGRPQVCVYAPELSRAALVDALRSGRTYLAESADVALELTATDGTTTAGPGEELTRRHPATVEATVTGAPGATVTLKNAAGAVAAGRLDRSGRGRLTVQVDEPGYVRAEVRAPRSRLGLPGRMLALSNPVWLTR
jgi:PHP-associated